MPLCGHLARILARASAASHYTLHLLHKWVVLALMDNTGKTYQTSVGVQCLYRRALNQRWLCAGKSFPGVNGTYHSAGKLSHFQLPPFFALANRVWPEIKAQNLLRRWNPEMVGWHKDWSNWRCQEEAPQWNSKLGNGSQWVSDQSPQARVWCSMT